VNTGPMTETARKFEELDIWGGFLYVRSLDL